MSLNSFAQFDINFFTDTTQQLNFYAGLDFTYGSNVMSNQFSNKFLFGGNIDRDLKDKAYKNLGDNNRLGGDLNYNLTAEIPFDTIFKKTGISLIVGVEFNEHVNVTFDENLFRLIFDGNKQFAGQTTNISQTNYNYYKFQRLNFGFVNYKKSKGKMAKEGVILSIIKGQEHEAANGSGTMTTEQYGRQIDLDLIYTYNSSDTANKGFKAFNGLGLSTDLFSEFYLQNGDKVYLGIEDLGFVHWNKNSIEIGTDSFYSYEGVVIDNIFNINDSLIDNLSKDSILEVISTNKEKEDYAIALPTGFHINYSKQFNQKLRGSVGVYYKILSSYFPLIYANTTYNFNPNFAFKSQIAWGGYGKYNIGFSLAKSIKNSFQIFIGTNNLEGFVVPSKAYSNSGFIGLKKYF